MTARILLLEDDRRLAEMLVEYLSRAGFEVSPERLAQTAVTRLRTEHFDALILDLMLPDLDGLEVCRQLRAEPPLQTLPILMLTARGDIADRVVGLELGADDYIAKPFDPRELLARVRALLRRGRIAPERPDRPLLHFGRLSLDREAFQARLDETPVAATPYQFALLQLLAEHAGRVLSRDFIIESLRGAASESFDRSIDVHISKLRQLLEDDPRRPRRILTIRGVGYLFARAQN